MAAFEVISSELPSNLLMQVRYHKHTTKNKVAKAKKSERVMLMESRLFFRVYLDRE